MYIYIYIYIHTYTGSFAELDTIGTHISTICVTVVTFGGSMFKFV